MTLVTVGWMEMQVMLELKMDQGVDADGFRDKFQAYGDDEKEQVLLDKLFVSGWKAAKRYLASGRVLDTLTDLGFGPSPQEIRKTRRADRQGPYGGGRGSGLGGKGLPPLPPPQVQRGSQGGNLRNPGIPGILYNDGQVYVNWDAIAHGPMRMRVDFDPTTIECMPEAQ